MATDLPEDADGFTNFDIEDGIDRLNAQMAVREITVEDMDERSKAGLNPVNIGRDFNDKGRRELNRLVSDTVRDSNMNDVDPIRSNEVDEFNQRFEVDIENDNPMFVGNRKNMNFVSLIQQSNQSYVKERDMYSVPPPNSKQSLMDKLNLKEKLQGFDLRTLTEDERNELRKLMPDISFPSLTPQSKP